MIVNVDIPEITQFANGFPRHWMNVFLLGNRPDEYRAHAVVTTYVRVVEGAFIHYALARENVNRFWNTHTSIAIGNHNLSSTYFEDCITLMHRAALCMTRIRGRKATVPADLKELFPNRPRFTADQVRGRLRRVRDAIQHMDEQVANGEIPQNTPFQLTAGGPETPVPDQPGQTLKVIDRLTIGDQTVLFTELVEWLIEMGQCAETISNYRRSEQQRTFTPISTE